MVANRLLVGALYLIGSWVRGTEIHEDCDVTLNKTCTDEVVCGLYGESNVIFLGGNCTLSQSRCSGMPTVKFAYNGSCRDSCNFQCPIEEIGPTCYTGGNSSCVDNSENCYNSIRVTVYKFCEVLSLNCQYEEKFGTSLEYNHTGVCQYEHNAVKMVPFSRSLFPMLKSGVSSYNNGTHLFWYDVKTNSRGFYFGRIDSWEITQFSRRYTKGTLSWGESFVNGSRWFVDASGRTWTIEKTNPVAQVGGLWYTEDGQVFKGNTNGITWSFNGTFAFAVSDNYDFRSQIGSTTVVRNLNNGTQKVFNGSEPFWEYLYYETGILDWGDFTWSMTSTTTTATVEPTSSPYDVTNPPAKTMICVNVLKLHNCTSFGHNPICSYEDSQLTGYGWGAGHPFENNCTFYSESCHQKNHTNDGPINNFDPMPCISRSSTTGYPDRTACEAFMTLDCRFFGYNPVCGSRNGSRYQNICDYYYSACENFNKEDFFALFQHTPQPCTEAITNSSSPIHYQLAMEVCANRPDQPCENLAYNPVCLYHQSTFGFRSWNNLCSLHKQACDAFEETGSIESFHYKHGRACPNYNSATKDVILNRCRWYARFDCADFVDAPICKPGGGAQFDNKCFFYLEACKQFQESGSLILFQDEPESCTNLTYYKPPMVGGNSTVRNTEMCKNLTKIDCKGMGYDPICMVDGREFESKCAFFQSACGAYKYVSGQLSGHVITRYDPMPCMIRNGTTKYPKRSTCEAFMTLDCKFFGYNPVCGRDGSMYENMCNYYYSACETFTEKNSLSSFDHMPELCNHEQVMETCKFYAGLDCDYVDFKPICGEGERRFDNLCDLYDHACEEYEKTHVLALFHYKQGTCANNETTTEITLPLKPTPESIRDGVVKMCRQFGNYKCAEFPYEPICGADTVPFNNKCFYYTEICKRFQETGSLAEFMYVPRTCNETETTPQTATTPHRAPSEETSEKLVIGGEAGWWIEKITSGDFSCRRLSLSVIAVVVLAGLN